MDEKMILFLLLFLFFFILSFFFFKLELNYWDMIRSIV
jgi:hypothetical protein